MKSTLFLWNRALLAWLLPAVVLTGCSIIAKYGPDTPLHDALSRCNKDGVSTLIDQGANVNALAYLGRPLHYANIGCNGPDGQAIVRMLIEKGADVMGRDSHGLTPLHNVKNREIAELLITKGADVNARNDFDHTPLHEADNREIAELLIAKGADVNARANDGRTPLHEAENREIAELLIAKGADVNARNDLNWTPLHQHAQFDFESKKEIVRLLIAKGANVNARDKLGRLAPITDEIKAVQKAEDEQRKAKWEQELARRNQDALTSSQALAAFAAGLGTKAAGGNTADVLSTTTQALESGNTGGVASQFAGAYSQAQQNKLNALKQQEEEHQRQLLAQQEQQRIAHTQQEQQRRAYDAEAARAEAFNREAARASEERARQKLSVAPSESVVGAQLNSIPREASQPSASNPRPLHIPSNQSGVLPGLDFVIPKDDRSKQEEKRERERAHRENVESYEAKKRERQAEQAEANRQRDAEAARQRQAQTQARATERMNLEAKVKAAIFASGAVVQYVDSKTCSSVFTNTTPYWTIVVWDYTLTREDTGSQQHQAVVELPPGQTRTWPVGVPACGKIGWSIPGGTITKKDAIQNYPFHLQ